MAPTAWQGATLWQQTQQQKKKRKKKKRKQTRHQQKKEQERRKKRKKACCSYARHCVLCAACDGHCHCLCAGFFTGPAVIHSAEWKAGWAEGWAEGFQMGQAPDVEDPHRCKGQMAVRTAARSYGLPTTMCTLLWTAHYNVHAPMDCPLQCV